MHLGHTKLPIIRLLGGNLSSTLHGYWKPPKYVISFWSNGCYFNFKEWDDYPKKKYKIINSLLRCEKTFYRMYHF